jgi:hypothetical protein
MYRKLFGHSYGESGAFIPQEAVGLLFRPVPVQGVKFLADAWEAALLLFEISEAKGTDLFSEAASGCSVPAGTIAGSVVHGGARAQVAPSHAQRIVSITDSGDRPSCFLLMCTRAVLPG